MINEDQNKLESIYSSIRAGKKEVISESAESASPEDLQSKLMPLIDWVDKNINVLPLEEVKQYAINFVKESTIADRDKRKTIVNIQGITNPTRLQTLLYNSILKFAGLGVVGNLPR